jgi:hypothetical protein
MFSYMELPRHHRASLDPAEVDRRELRQLERAGGWSRRERLRAAWYRLRLIVQEMNYSVRRLTEMSMALPADTKPADTRDR